MHTLFLEPDLEELIDCCDLYIFDKHSWCCIKELLDLLADANFFNGLADGCLLPNLNEVKFAWTLHNSNHHNSEENHIFYWCLIPPVFKQLLVSYASCKTLYMGFVFCATANCNHDLGFPQVLKINLIMSLLEDLQFYSTVCIHPSSNAPESWRSSSRAAQYQSCVEPVSHIAADSIESVDNLKVEVLSPKKTCTQLTEICMSSNNTISLLIPDASKQVPENDLKWLKTEVTTDENGDDQDRNEPSFGTLKVVKKMPDRNMAKNTLRQKKLFHIAQTYRALYCCKDVSYSSHPFPPIKDRAKRIILECPACNIPSSCSSLHGFLKLLRHVKRRHLKHANELFADIEERYSPLLECMNRRIAKTNMKYSSGSETSLMKIGLL